MATCESFRELEEILNKGNAKEMPRWENPQYSSNAELEGKDFTKF